MKLTNLQRLGISYMLLDLVYKGANMLKGGGIASFHITPENELYMKFECYSGFTYVQILKNENIDIVYMYKYEWDGIEKLFHIIDLDGKEQTA